VTVLRLVRWELFKLSRQRASYVGFVLSLAFVIIMVIGFKMSRWHYLKKFQTLGFNPLDLLHGPFFAHYTLQIGFFAFLPLMAATLGGSQIAGEAQAGTLRVLLVRPPSRIAVFLAKSVATWLWLQLNVLFLVALAILVGEIAFGDGPMLVFVWEFRAGGPWVVDSPDWWALLLVVTLGAGVSLFLISALSLMISTFTDSPVVAHVSTLGAYFISSIVEHMPEQLIGAELRAALPTTHMGFRLQLYRFWDPVPGTFDAAAFWTDLLICGGFSVLFLGIGLFWFDRKDVTS
jgi:hypothetical protein